MKVIVSKENATIKGSYFKIGEFSDLWHPVLFINSILGDYDDNGNSCTLKVDFISTEDEHDGWVDAEAENPEAPGLYLCTLESKAGREIDIRFFGDAKENASWIMDGQPDEGYVWTKSCGGIAGERVVAWMPLPEVYGGF